MKGITELVSLGQVAEHELSTGLKELVPEQAMGNEPTPSSILLVDEQRSP